MNDKTPSFEIKLIFFHLIRLLRTVLKKFIGWTALETDIDQVTLFSNAKQNIFQPKNVSTFMDET